MFKKIISGIIICLVFIFSACKSKKESTDEHAVTDTVQANKQTLDTAGFSILPNRTADSDSVLLLFNPPSGKTFKLSNESNFAISFKQGDKEATEKDYAYSTFKLTTTQKDEYANTLIELIQTSSKTSTEVGGQKITYQSGVPAQDPQQEMQRQLMDCLINTPVQIIMNPLGQIAGSDGMKNVKVKLQKLLGDSIDVNQIPIADPAESMQSGFVVFPGKPLAIGNSWTGESTTSLQGLPIILTNTYTLTDRKDGISYLTLKASVRFDKKSMPPEALKNMGEIKITGYVNGNIQIDEYTGWPIVFSAYQVITSTETYQQISAVTSLKGSITIKASMN